MRLLQYSLHVGDGTIHVTECKYIAQQVRGRPSIIVKSKEEMEYHKNFIGTATRKALIRYKVDFHFFEIYYYCTSMGRDLLIREMAKGSEILYRKLSL